MLNIQMNSSTKVLRFICLAALLCCAPARAADPALVERIPAGVKPVAAERGVLEALAPKVYELNDPGC